MWNIEGFVKHGEYTYAKVKNYPGADRGKYAYAHRVIMENHLGRKLEKNEIVHHKNGNKHDNCLENLEVMLVGEHEKMHSRTKGRKVVILKCPCCNKIFERDRRQTHLIRNNRYSCCSRKCNSKFSRGIQLKGMTLETIQSISANVVCEEIRYLD